VPICQIFYHQLIGEYRTYSSDKYHNNRDIQPSLLYKELNPDAGKDDPQLTIDFGKAPH
jgi:dCTP deaminase